MDEILKIKPVADKVGAFTSSGFSASVVGTDLLGKTRILSTSPS